MIARHNDILKELEISEYVLVQDLCEKYNVSSVTIRKDLNYLEGLGLLYRTHGGASRQSRFASERNVNEKESIKVEEKKSIARIASEIINENDTIIMASGTTMHYLARAMVNFQKLTVLTSSLRVALELCKMPNITVIQLGGEVRKSSTSIVGSISEAVLDQFSCNKLFLGVDGIDLEFGISCSSAAEAHLNQAMIRCADKLIVLADSSKINKKGFGKIADIDRVDVIITDENIDPQSKQKLEDLGIEVLY